MWPWHFFFSEHLQGWCSLEHNPDTAGLPCGSLAVNSSRFGGCLRETISRTCDSHTSFVSVLLNPSLNTQRDGRGTTHFLPSGDLESVPSLIQGNIVPPLESRVLQIIAHFPRGSENSLHLFPLPILPEKAHDANMSSALF